MEIFQEILVFVVFAIAVSYMVTKFIWKPAFLKAGKRGSKGCGDTDCGCS